jgi:hypothetical protein
MLITEFGQQFARRFEQQHPRTFYRLVKTTQTKITWRPPVTPLKLLEQIV